ncbi:3519_t:CDS:1, partial [Funneliformis geosporum]
IEPYQNRTVPTEETPIEISKLLDGKTELFKMISQAGKFQM